MMGIGGIFSSKRKRRRTPPIVPPPVIPSTYGADTYGTGYYGASAIPPPVGPVLGAEKSTGASFGGNQYQCNLRMNPINPNRIAITMKHDFGELNTAIMTTIDGGTTWTSLEQPAGGDPDVVYDNTGSTIHWTFINDSPAGHGYKKSVNGGVTWSARVNIAQKIDHPFINIDRSSTSPYFGSLYTAGRISTGGFVVAYSRDNGVSWTPVSGPGTGLNYPGTPGTIGMGFVDGISILKDGTIVIPVLGGNNILSTGNPPVYAGSHRDMFVLRSTNGGLSFTTAFVGALDTPATPGTGIGFAGMSMAVGDNGSGGERLYITYVQPFPSPAPKRLTLVTSDDKGITWSAPRQIAPVVPTNTWGAGPCSAMVNKDGVVGVQFYSTNSASNFNLYFVYSKDNGATFLPNPPLRISTVTSTEPSGTPAQSRSIGQDQNFGDVDSNGVFHLLWTDNRSSTNNYTIYTRTVDVA